LNPPSRITPRRILRGLNWLVLAIAAAVGVVGVINRQQAEVVVDWSTASELNTVGYNLYRSEQPAGQYTRINKEIIYSSDDPLTGGSYSYKDPEVLPGHVYYYQLEEIEQSGATNRHGPIEVRAIAGGSSELILAATLIGLGVLGLLATKDQAV